MSKEKLKKSVGFERVYKVWEYLKRNTDSEHPTTQAEMRKDPDLSTLMGHKDTFNSLIKNMADIMNSDEYGCYKPEKEWKIYFHDFKRYLIYEELTAGGKDYLLVHGGLGSYSPEKEIEDYSIEELVWDRADDETQYFEDIYVVTGAYANPGNRRKSETVQTIILPLTADVICREADWRLYVLIQVKNITRQQTIMMTVSPAEMLCGALPRPFKSVDNLALILYYLYMIKCCHLKGGAHLEIIESILTNNPCYKAGKRIKVKGLMLHSVGCPQPSAEVFVKKWNSPDASRACVHAFIDGNNGKVYQTLPWDYRAWHCGGTANNTHIGVEMCEPACIKYTGGSTFTCSDREAAMVVVKRTYDTAVELFAYLCKQFGLDPMADGVIISHKEGHDRGLASGHQDPSHLWNGLQSGYTMDGFRRDVQRKI